MINLTPEELDELRYFQERYGRTWKQKVRDHWAASTGGPVLQRLRNEAGPSWLKAFRLPPATPVTAPPPPPAPYLAYLAETRGRALDITV